MKGTLIRVARRLIPRRVRRGISKLASWPPPGLVRFGSLRRVTPISSRFGYDRGEAIDRHYIHRFLEERAAAIHGTVLEIGAKMYAPRFGRDRVERLEVLHVAEWLPDVTVIGDLTDPELFPEDTFDCIILTQTLPFIYDVSAAVANCGRFLKPGGTVLATFNGISQVSRADMDRWGHYWSFTTLSASRLFTAGFPDGEVEVVSYGNVLSGIAFLHGLSIHELRREELDAHDPDYQLVIGVRAVKATAPS